MSKTEAESYLQSLLCKTLRITTTDSRMFLGQFKCTDSVCPPSPPYSPSPFPHSSLLTPPPPPLQDRNIILSQTFEYRQPTPPTIAELTAAAAEGKTIHKDMTPRFLGLVVVPGEHIVNIMVEEFASQVKGKGRGRGVEGVDGAVV